MRCAVCNGKVEETFMKKLIGTYIRKKGSSKKYPVCMACQKKYMTKEDLLKNIK